MEAVEMVRKWECGRCGKEHETRNGQWPPPCGECGADFFNEVTARWECFWCGWKVITFSDEPPEKCPRCGLERMARVK